MAHALSGAYFVFPLVSWGMHIGHSRSRYRWLLGGKVLVDQGTRTFSNYPRFRPPPRLMSTVSCWTRLALLAFVQPFANVIWQGHAVLFRLDGHLNLSCRNLVFSNLHRSYLVIKKPLTLP